MIVDVDRYSQYILLLAANDAMTTGKVLALREVRNNASMNLFQEKMKTKMATVIRPLMLIGSATQVSV